MAADLQDLVDDLADALGRPVALEDRRWRLLAFSAHTELEDRVRQASILARAAPSDVVAWLDTLGLEQAPDVVDTPENSAIGMGPRTCAPVRHAGTLLGFLWVIPGSVPLDDGQRATLVATARAAGATLWAQRAGGGEAHARIAALLGELLDDPDAAVRARAAGELAVRQGWSLSRPTPYTVALAELDDGEAATQVAERARRRWQADDLVWRVRGTVATVIAHGGSAPQALAQALVDAGAPHVVASAGFAELAAARDAGAGAAAGLVAVQHVPRLGPAATVDALGSWVFAARLWDASGRPAVVAPLPPLLRARAGGDLAEALEATLDAGGDVAAAARALHVHRATLYRRLARAEELTGLRLSSGDDRLRAHLALRMWRLAGSPALG
ncbi:helix-turn-helix domain-containing protein [Baekduia sp. Peel2402]|uniref:helix-turn-helix domain-containing protein n=1 Tax=Baekduia sp. Peel2402 TaxID=3458296 RepID=UPI00403EAA47